MRSARWWKRQKKRVRKKYTYLFGLYFSPKEIRAHQKMNALAWRRIYWENRMAWRRAKDGVD